MHYRLLCDQPLRTWFVFKPNKPQDKHPLAKGHLLVYVELSTIEYGPFPTDIEGRQKSWKERALVKPPPTSQALTAAIKQLNQVFDLAHKNLLLGKVQMTGLILMDEVNRIQSGREGQQNAI